MVKAKQPHSPAHLLPFVVLYALVLCFVDLGEPSGETRRVVILLLRAAPVVFVVGMYYLPLMLNLMDLEMLCPGRFWREVPIIPSIASYFIFTFRVCFLSALEAAYLVMLLGSHDSHRDLADPPAYFVPLFLVAVLAHILVERRRLGAVAWIMDDIQGAEEGPGDENSLKTAPPIKPKQPHSPAHLLAMAVLFVLVVFLGDPRVAYDMDWGYAMLVYALHGMGAVAMYYLPLLLNSANIELFALGQRCRDVPRFRNVASYVIFVIRVWVLSGFEATSLVILLASQFSRLNRGEVTDYIIALTLFAVLLHCLVERRRLGPAAWFIDENTGRGVELDPEE